jgi:hypothetical protein
VAPKSRNRALAHVVAAGQFGKGRAFGTPGLGLLRRRSIAAAGPCAARAALPGRGLRRCGRGSTLSRTRPARPKTVSINRLCGTVVSAHAQSYKFWSEFFTQINALQYFCVTSPVFWPHQFLRKCGRLITGSFDKLVLREFFGFCEMRPSERREQFADQIGALAEAPRLDGSRGDECGFDLGEHPWQRDGEREERAVKVGGGHLRFL